MATLLILDASSTYCSVALIRDDQTFELTELQPRRHAQRLLPMVDELLAANGVPRQEVDCVAFGRGPGSFTGIRIAISVAQGISLGLDIPVYGFSSLAVVAQQVMMRSSATRVMVVMDAHMGEVFWGAFELHNGLATAISAEQVGAPARCAADLQAFDGVIAGNGIKVAGVMDEQITARAEAILDDAEPLAGFAAPLVSSAWEQGKFAGADQYAPVYLRDSVAWKKLDEQPSLLKR